jgi:hypothetical protein
MASSPEPASPITPHTPGATTIENSRSTESAREREVPGLLSDCRLMLSYARKNAFVLPPALLREIAWLDSFLKSKKIAPISSISSELVSTIDVVTNGEPRYMVVAIAPVSTPPGSPAAAAPVPLPATPTLSLSAEEVILDIHGELSTLISPTTALSLQTSEPPPGKTHVLGGMPPLVRTVIGVAVCSALVFVATALGIARNAAKAVAGERANSTGLTASAPGPSALRAGNADASASARPSTTSSMPLARDESSSGVKP